MKKVWSIVFTITVLQSMIVPVYAFQDTIYNLTASMNASSQEVTIRGKISYGAGKNIILSVFDPSANIDNLNQTKSSEDGEFIYKYKMQAPSIGKYIVKIAVEGTSDIISTSFICKKSSIFITDSDIDITYSDADITDNDIDITYSDITGNKEFGFIDFPKQKKQLQNLLVLSSNEIKTTYLNFDDNVGSIDFSKHESYLLGKNHILPFGGIGHHSSTPIITPPAPSIHVLDGFPGRSPDDEAEAVVLYDDSYETKLYKCWKDGKSGEWDGITDNAPGCDNVKNAAVLRRGKTMFVTDEAGMNANTIVKVFAPSNPGIARNTVEWEISWDASKNAASIEIPGDAPIGDYQVQIGENRENYVTVYVLFDPSWAKNELEPSEFESWAYKDVEWSTLLDDKNYLNYCIVAPLDLFDHNHFSYRGSNNSEEGANGGIFGQRMVEMAASIHGANTVNSLEAVVHAYQVLGQRLPWIPSTGFDIYEENDTGKIYNTFDKVYSGSIIEQGKELNKLELDIATAKKAALGMGFTDRLSADYVMETGICWNHGTSMAALIRSMGIPSRPASTTGGGAGWGKVGFHVWSEAALDAPLAKPADRKWWKGIWWKIDSCDPLVANADGLEVNFEAHIEGNIAPVVIDGFGDYLLNEYQKSNGMSYIGKYEKGTGSFTSAKIKPGTDLSAEAEYIDDSSPWQIVNSYVPWNGPDENSDDEYAVDGHHGYVLNKTQKGAFGGQGYIENETGEDDLPELIKGIDQRGLVAGLGFMLYRVPVGGLDFVTVQLTEGADKVEFFGTLDRPIYSKGGRWNLDYDFASSNGIMNVDTKGKEQLYIFIQLKGKNVQGNEASWFTIRTDEELPVTVIQEGKDFKAHMAFTAPALEGNNRVNATAKVENISSKFFSGTKDILLITALYDSCNTMKDISFETNGVQYRNTVELTTFIDLPQNVDGYTMKAFLLEGNSIASSKMKPVSSTLQVNKENNIALKGTISLPNDDNAPAGGINVSILAVNEMGTKSDSSDDVAYKNTLTIPEGKKSSDFSITVPGNGKGYVIKYSFNVNKPSGYYYEGYYKTWCTVYDNELAARVISGNEDIENINLKILHELTSLQGKITLPDNDIAPFKGVRLSVNAINSYTKESTLGSTQFVIIEGRNSYNYTLKVPITDELFTIGYSTEENDPDYLNGFYTKSGTVFNRTLAEKITINENTGDLDIIVLKGTKIQGKVINPGSALSFDNLTVKLEPVDRNNKNEPYILLELKKGEESKDYHLLIPKDSNGYRLSYETETVSGYYKQAYYSDGEMVTELEKATIFHGVDGDKNIDLTIKKLDGITIKGTLSLPAGETAGEDITAIVEAINNNGTPDDLGDDRAYDSKNLKIPEGKTSVSYSIVVPKNSGNYLIRYRAYYGEEYLENAYYSETGTVKEADNASTVSANTSNISSINVSFLKP